MGRWSTNALTKRYCALKGWPWENVQFYYGGRRHDLFGIADAVVLQPGAGLLFVQNCSYGTRDEHARAIDANPILPQIMQAGVWVELWEWKRKKVGRRLEWFLQIQERAATRWSEPTGWDGPHDLYPR